MVRCVQWQVVCVKLTSATSQPSEDQPGLHFIDGGNEIISLGDYATVAVWVDEGAHVFV